MCTELQPGTSHIRSPVILTQTLWGEKIGRSTTYITDPGPDDNNNLIYSGRPLPYMRGNLAPIFPSQELEVFSAPFYRWEVEIAVKELVESCRNHAHLFAHTHCSSQNMLVPHAAAGVVLLKIKGDYFTSLLKTLHWLPTALRIKFENLTEALDNLTSFNSPHLVTVATPSCCSSNFPSMVPPQGLGTCSSPCLERAFPNVQGLCLSCHSDVVPISLSRSGPSAIIKQHSVTL